MDLATEFQKLGANIQSILKKNSTENRPNEATIRQLSDELKNIKRELNGISKNQGELKKRIEEFRKNEEKSELIEIVVQFRNDKNFLVLKVRKNEKIKVVTPRIAEKFQDLARIYYVVIPTQRNLDNDSTFFENGLETGDVIYCE